MANPHKFITNSSSPKLSWYLFVKRALWIVLTLGHFSVFAQNNSGKKDSINVSVKKTSGLDAQVEYSADDSVVLDIPGKKVYLYGNAKVHYNDINLDAGFIMVNFETKDILATPYPDSTGNYVHKPHFSDGKDQFTSDSMKYNFSVKNALVYNARTVQDDGFIYGEKTYKDPLNQTYVKNARYTTCNDTVHPHFYILTKKLKIVPKKQVITGPANLVIADINTPLVIPFGFFPILQGQTRGVIFPTYGESQDQGFFLRNLGYYLPVSQYFDLALTSDIYLRGGFGIHLNSNYVKRYRFRGNIGFDFVKNKFVRSETEVAVQNDYTFKWNYVMDQKARPGQSFSANIQYQSNNYNKNNSTQQQDIILSTVQSNMNYSTSFLRKNVNMSSGLRVIQNFGREEVDLSFPELNLSVPRITPFGNSSIRSKGIKTIGISYNGDFRNSVVMKQKNLGPSLGLENNPDKINILDSLQNSIIHTIPLSASFKLFKYFQLNPGISYNEYWYFKSEERFWDDVNDTLLSVRKNSFDRANSVQGSLTLNTQLFGLAQFKRGKIQAIRHVLTPSINMGFRPDMEIAKKGFRTVQSDTSGEITRYNIYSINGSGYPSGGKQASLGFNLNNNLEMKTRKLTDTGMVTKKIKLIEMLNVSASHNFLADSFKWSNLSFNGRSSLLNNKLSINYNWILDPYRYTDRRINTLVVSEKFSLGRLVSAGMSLGTNLNPQARKEKTSKYATAEELRMINNYPQHFADFNIPWSLQINYNLNYSKFSPLVEKTLNQTVTFNGDLNLTDNWKIGFASGYDFSSKELAVTKIDMYRNLHCWEFSFGWIPTGFLRSYTFTIKVKSSTLQDLKLNRRNFWFDN
ncbi:MAG: LPS-assembly protein LptD [Flavobacteriales bacterium]|nr:LPS-assembly protein LptD [Flavobacteriales bacterium]